MASETTGPNDGGEERVKLLRDQVKDVLIVMEGNVKSLDERGSKIGYFEDTANKLKEDAEKFKHLANENKRKQMWENRKMIIILCIALVIIIMLVIIAHYYA